MRTIFHLTTKMAWEQSQISGCHESETLTTEGFLHLSRPHQLHGVVSRYFQGVSNLVLLQVNQEEVTAPVKYEGGEDNKFPHIYGPLNLDAVVGVFDLDHKERDFQLPAELQLVEDTLIRLGLPGDEAEITSVHTHAWQQSYKGIVPDTFLAERPLSFHSRLKWWKSVVEGKDPWTVYVAESAMHGIIGFCGFGPAREEELKSHGEVGAIYCLNEYKGKGVGAALLRAAHAHQKKSGHSHSYLWVLEENPTVNFYRRMGGCQLDKKKMVEFGGKSLTELAFEWKL